MEQNKNNYRFAFFGTSKLSVMVLDKLAEHGFIPTLIISAEDKPQGRKLVLTPTETKTWADGRGIPCLQLKTLRTDDVVEKIQSYSPKGYDLFVVASYGKIIPQAILDIPRRGTLNVHPSLLPRLRGASPIKSAIISEDETGVTIMLLDAEMDHGPIIAQEKTASWKGFMEPYYVGDELPYAYDLQQSLGHRGGEMLAGVFVDWIEGKVEAHEQDHSKATLCGKIKKENGEINLDDSAEINLRKIRAYHEWPTAYYFHTHNNKKVRVIIKRARVENGQLILERVLPEGKKEMSYADFERGLR